MKATVTLLLLGLALLSCTATAQERVGRIDGASGVACITSAAVKEFNNATAFLSDTDFDATIEHIGEATKKQCFFGPLSGLITRVELTFVRKDNQVIDVFRYTPSHLMGTFFYVFRARPLSTDAGL